MILRFLNILGIAGLAAGLALAILLLVQKGETRHWRKQSGQFEQLYRDEQSALAATQANYRAAADAARAADLANAARVAAEQGSINERTAHDFQTRLAAARGLRVEPQAAADPGRGGNPPVPGLSAAAGGAAQIAGEDRLPQSDALIATEQAIQLDELVKWVKRQAAVDIDGADAPSTPIERR